jgi:hypothetical protein
MIQLVGSFFLTGYTIPTIGRCDTAEAACIATHGSVVCF